jgi:hypothetical protein
MKAGTGLQLQDEDTPQVKLLSEQYEKKAHFWMNLRFVSGVMSWGTLIALMFLAPTGEPSRSSTDEFQAMSCNETEWLWVENYNETTILLLLISTLGWMCTGMFSQAFGRSPKPLVNADVVQKNKETGAIAGVLHFVPICLVISFAAIMLAKGFGPDLGGDSLCDAWNQPEGDERKIFGAVWGGLLSTSVVTFMFNTGAMYNLQKSRVEKEKETITQRNKI